MIDLCPNCGEKILELIKEHNIVICFKCKWMINAESWHTSWNF